MDFLNARHSAALLRVTQLTNASSTLLEQIEPYLKLSPHAILDLDNVVLNSMRLGELVNVVQAYRAHWGIRFQGLHLVRLSDTNRRALSTARLEAILRAHDTTDAALAAIDRVG